MICNAGYSWKFNISSVMHTNIGREIMAHIQCKKVTLYATFFRRHISIIDYFNPFLFISYIYIYSFACNSNSYWCQYICLVHRCLTFPLLPHQMNKKQPGHRSHPMRFLCDSICNKDIIGLGFAGHLWICIAIRGRCSPTVDPKVAANVGTKI